MIIPILQIRKHTGRGYKQLPPGYTAGTQIQADRRARTLHRLCYSQSTPKSHLLQEASLALSLSVCSALCPLHHSTHLYWLLVVWLESGAAWV